VHTVLVTDDPLNSKMNLEPPQLQDFDLYMDPDPAFDFHVDTDPD
jgi:hypothetical protein